MTTMTPFRDRVITDDYLFRQILNYLRPKDLVQAALTCWDWNPPCTLALLESIHWSAFHSYELYHLVRYNPHRGIVPTSHRVLDMTTIPTVDYEKYVPEPPELKSAHEALWKVRKDPVYVELVRILVEGLQTARRSQNGRLANQRCVLNAMDDPADLCWSENHGSEEIQLANEILARAKRLDQAYQTGQESVKDELTVERIREMVLRRQETIGLRQLGQAYNEQLTLYKEKVIAAAMKLAGQEEKDRQYQREVLRTMARQAVKRHGRHIHRVYGIDSSVGLSMFRADSIKNLTHLEILLTRMGWTTQEDKANPGEYVRMGGVIGRIPSLQFRDRLLDYVRALELVQQNCGSLTHLNWSGPGCEGSVLAQNWFVEDGNERASDQRRFAEVEKYLPDGLNSNSPFSSPIEPCGMDQCQKSLPFCLDLDALHHTAGPKDQVCLTLVSLTLNHWHASIDAFIRLLGRSPYLIKLDLSKCIFASEPHQGTLPFQHNGIRFLTASLGTLYSKPRHEALQDVLKTYRKDITQPPPISNGSIHSPSKTHSRGRHIIRRLPRSLLQYMPRVEHWTLPKASQYQPQDENQSASWIRREIRETCPRLNNLTILDPGMSTEARECLIEALISSGIQDVVSDADAENAEEHDSIRRKQGLAAGGTDSDEEYLAYGLKRAEWTTRITSNQTGLQVYRSFYGTGYSAGIVASLYAQCQSLEVLDLDPLAAEWSATPPHIYSVPLAPAPFSLHNETQPHLLAGSRTIQRYLPDPHEDLYEETLDLIRHSSNMWTLRPPEFTCALQDLVYTNDKGENEAIEWASASSLQSLWMRFECLWFPYQIAEVMLDLGAIACPVYKEPLDRTNHFDGITRLPHSHTIRTQKTSAYLERQLGLGNQIDLPTHLNQESPRYHSSFMDLAPGFDPAHDPQRTESQKKVLLFLRHFPNLEYLWIGWGLYRIPGRSAQKAKESEEEDSGDGTTYRVQEKDEKDEKDKNRKYKEDRSDTARQKKDKALRDDIPHENQEDTRSWSGRESGGQRERRVIPGEGKSGEQGGSSKRKRGKDREPFLVIIKLPTALRSTSQVIIAENSSPCKKRNVVRYKAPAEGHSSSH